MSLSSFTHIIIHSFFLQVLLLKLLVPQSASASSGGQWQLLQKSIGVVSMHMQLLSNDRLVIFDRTDFGRSNLSLPNGKCRNDPTERAVKLDCTAHSVEYDISSNTFCPLFVQTDVWCSSGAVDRDGRLIQTGGFGDGERKVRIYSPCQNTTDGCDWVEVGDGLKQTRWYATNHILPDGRQIVIGGRRQFNFEYYPKTGAPDAYTLRFLAETTEPDKVENNLYPFVFLNVDGNLFIFANNRSILFSYIQNKIVRTYPDIPGGDPRSYPSTGSAVLLPLKNLQSPNLEAEVLICGGAPRGSYQQAMLKNFIPALDNCGRIKITDSNPQWVMETMPQARVMGDMILLPNGNVLIINGAAVGTAAWEFGRNPVLNPVQYHPNYDIGYRFELQNPTTIPRMYHSTAVLVRDGRVIVGGSNPHIYYDFRTPLFPTELSLEAFSPSYLDPQFNNLRPKIISPRLQSGIAYRQKLVIRFQTMGALDTKLVRVTMVSPSFNTHSFSMNQRLLVLGNDSVTIVNPGTYDVYVTAPVSPVLAPPGYYMIFVVHQEIPSEGIWVKIG